MNLVVSYDQMSAVLDGSVLLKAVPLNLRADGSNDWSAGPVTLGSPCLGCPISPDGGRSACAYYTGGTAVCCDFRVRKDGRTIVWRKC